jgi:membrane protease YdiL (CAAX protease family)
LSQPVESGSLSRFFALAYLITWLLLGPWFFLFNRVWDRTVPWWGWLLVPVAFWGGYGPSLAAIVEGWRAGGRRAVSALLRSLLVWRVRAGWYILAVLGPYALAALAAFLARVPGFVGQFSLGASLASAPLALALALPFGPLGEEVGWRGYALPRLVHRLGPWGGSLALGAAWTFWHLPMMLLQPGAALPSYMPVTVGSAAAYLAQTTGITGVMTLVYYETRGSTLLAVLLHLTFNVSDGVLLNGLPDQATSTLRRVYLANVGVDLLAGLVALACLTLLRGRPDAGSRPESGIVA